MAAPGWLACAVVLCAAAACAPSSAPRSAPAAVAPPSPQDPTKLVGLWTVTEAGDEPGLVLRVAGDVSLWRECGVQFGGWAAAETGLLLLTSSAYTGECTPAQRATPWLTSAVAFQELDDGVLLTGERGEPLARLTPGGRPNPHPNVAESEMTPPVLGADQRASLGAVPAPLPAGLTPATRAQLSGRWDAADGVAGGAAPGSSVDLLDDGSFRGRQDLNDACAPSGHWAADDEGRLLSTSYIRAAVYCGPTTEVGDGFLAASRAGFDETELVLLDADGDGDGAPGTRGSTTEVAARSRPCRRAAAAGQQVIRRASPQRAGSGISATWWLLASATSRVSPGASTSACGSSTSLFQTLPLPAKVVIRPFGVTRRIRSLEASAM